jgi:hypothetical protein
MDTSDNDNSPASAWLAATLQAALGEATDQFRTLLSTMKAYDDTLGAVFDATADNSTSGTSSFSATLGALFEAWVARVQKHEGQLAVLLPPSVQQSRSQRDEAVHQVGVLGEKLAYLESLSVRPSGDSVLMEHLSGIATKVTSFADRCQKALDGPARPPGLSASDHAVGVGGTAEGKSKKRPAIFGEDPPVKRSVSDAEVQRVQDLYAIPRDWDWTKITKISPLMKACKGRIPPESALLIADAFEFRPRGASPATGGPVVAGAPPLAGPQHLEKQ